MFPTARTIPLIATLDQALTHALNTWRESASVVSARWQVFLEARSEDRAWAFASYVAALDDEEAAAAELAELSSAVRA
jgi:hypothetical protein